MRNVFLRVVQRANCCQHSGKRPDNPVRADAGEAEDRWNGGSGAMMDATGRGLSASDNSGTQQQKDTFS